jgi:mercuric ion transport protein
MSQTLSNAPPRIRGGALSFLSLFTSLGTLLCCALPSLLVLFGLGATVATVLSEVPWLVSLSHHKHWVFIVSGLLITGNFVYVYLISPKLQMRNGACDPNDPAACQTASRFSRIVLWCSAAVYLVGCFTAYILGPLLVRFDS